MKLYDLSQPLNQDVSFWPFYPPFEVKYIKRKSEQGVNAQYIQTSNHMGTHLRRAAPLRHQGQDDRPDPAGVAVRRRRDRRPERRARRARHLYARDDRRAGGSARRRYPLHPHRLAQARLSAPTADEEKYIHRHPGPHFGICDWLLKKKIHVWGVDMISTDHPMNLPIGRFLGKGGLEHWQKVRNAVRGQIRGREHGRVVSRSRPTSSRTTRSFPKDCIHVENLGGEIGAAELQNRRLTLGVFPWLFKGGEAAFCRAVAFVDEPSLRDGSESLRDGSQ